MRVCIYMYIIQVMHVLQFSAKKNNEKLSLVAELLAFMLAISLSHTAWKKKGKLVEEFQEKRASD